jgi:hypothetical protein
MWAEQETVCAVKAFLHSTDDPLKGIHQTSTVFWGKVAAECYRLAASISNTTLRETCLERTPSAIRGRVQLMGLEVGWFENYYHRSEIRQSGSNERDWEVACSNAWLSKKNDEGQKTRDAYGRKHGREVTPVIYQAFFLRLRVSHSLEEDRP